MRQQIEDDLTDYEEDVERDTFNTYRLYIRLHGPKRAPEALAAWISRLESQLHSLQQASPSRVRSCRRYPPALMSIPRPHADETNSDARFLAATDSGAAQALVRRLRETLSSGDARGRAWWRELLHACTYSGRGGLSSALACVEIVCFVTDGGPSSCSSFAGRLTPWSSELKTKDCNSVRRFT